MERQEEVEDRARLLPDDVLADVLSRLAPRGLATSRSVCTAWRAVIDGRGLLRADLLPPRSLAGLFIRYGSELAAVGRAGLFSRRPWTDATTYRRLPRSHFEDHCNGLLLLHDAVLNPVTGRRAPLPACPPLPAGMEYFIRDMYLVFDPAAATSSSPAQYEVVSVPRVPDRDHPDDELTKKLRLMYRNYPRKRTRVGRSLLGSEWPPSPYVLDVFSSATGRWEKRSFARDGEAAGILADMQPDFYPWEARRRSVYWKGALYVHSERDFVIRISMSNNTYHIIKPPRGIPDTYGQIYLRLGRSEKGVYSAFLGEDSKLQVWILESSSSSSSSSRGEKMEWTLRHDSGPGLFQASLNCGRQGHGPWILHDPTNDDDNKEEEPASAVEHTSSFDEWNSDDDDDDNVLNVGDPSSRTDCGYLEILGFHPYKEIVFLHRRYCRGLAYHLKTSKLEDLGHLYPPRSETSSIQACVPYTPYFAGELPGSL